MNEITLKSDNVKKYFGGAVLIREKEVKYITFAEKRELSQKGKIYIPLPRFYPNLTIKIL